MVKRSERGGRVWQRLRGAVLERDGYRCRACGKLGHDDRTMLDGDYLEVDHVVEVADGGDNSASNLLTKCRECHRAKTNEGLRRRARVRRGGMLFGADGWPIAEAD